MGTWGIEAFENDEAADWRYELERTTDFSLIESTFDQLEEIGDDYLETDIACRALAACEVLARLIGNTSYRDAFTENVDAWVVTHKLKPTPALLKRACAAIDSILGEESELRDLWEETAEGTTWLKSVKDLRRRLLG